ncbi:MAG: hypothetical protein IJH84_08210 [Saccharopolyspora sp.]|nr:hypothetical protein [Saccharopolyspora sp.]MBQ6641004.1 hypothetical protein [Saccharopolyspora sp.]
MLPALPLPALLLGVGSALMMIGIAELAGRSAAERGREPAVTTARPGDA